MDYFVDIISKNLWNESKHDVQFQSFLKWRNVASWKWFALTILRQTNIFQLNKNAEMFQEEPKHVIQLNILGGILANICLFIFNNRNSTKRYEIYSKLTTWRRTCIFMVNIEHISHLFLVLFLFALKWWGLFVGWWNSDFN